MSEFIGNPKEIFQDCNCIGLAAINGAYYAAWTPTKHSAVHFMYSTDGFNFAETFVTPTDGYGGASIAAYNGRLFLAFHGGDANHSLCMFEILLDATGRPHGLGTKWQSIQSSDDPPLLLPSASGLFIGWLGRGNKHLCIARVSCCLDCATSKSCVQSL